MYAMLSRFNCGVCEEIKIGRCILKAVVHGEEGMLENQDRFLYIFWIWFKIRCLTVMEERLNVRRQVVGKNICFGGGGW
jgi:hypothetical protein